MRFTQPLLCVAMLVSTVVTLVIPAESAVACPFCSATAQTFTEEFNAMKVAVIAKLSAVAPEQTAKGDDPPKAKFEILQLIKGGELVKIGDSVETLYFGDRKLGEPFLITGVLADPNLVSKEILWSTPLPVSPRAIEYLTKLLTLPASGAERLAFMQMHLEDADEMLARDAYDEFAGAPYAAVKELKSKMDHKQIVTWINNPEIPGSRRRLYFVMLGICGSPADAPMLEGFMKSTDRKQKAGLDSLIACYLTLLGEKGLPAVEDLYLKNASADYADTYSAVLALRFHGTEGNVIARPRLIESLRLMLARPDLADLVIPDLARWEDWESAETLFKLFESANETNSWVRMPIVNYFRLCPAPKGPEYLKSCEKIDEAAVKRAFSQFPNLQQAPPSPDKATRIEKRNERLSKLAGANPPRTADVAVASGNDASQVRTASAEMAISKAPQATASAGGNSREEVSSEVLETAAAGNNPPTTVAANLGAAPAAALKTSGTIAVNHWGLLGVPWAVAFALFVVQWSLLRRR
ncbi:hypothetical protein Psta_2112 [Pirellula staleyi DSM 6068]|uniref:Uncharacterized protein n=1 Tax=Pirellula staleyi (strain ATCC 27377 / DSM 6068 / ICPB 4128) TaxID=530564 RepID=D2R1R7_PIRSD|nr:hypothetical protein [Pirellula staleyi]ADB16786.1 hypothetical protein Psta_2112 [Pirellula staleyi DSM 6068]